MTREEAIEEIVGIAKYCDGGFLEPYVADKILNFIEAIQRENLVDLEWEGEEEEDPTPWCHYCGAMVSKHCDCGPIADNN